MSREPNGYHRAYVGEAFNDVAAENEPVTPGWCELCKTGSRDAQALVRAAPGDRFALPARVLLCGVCAELLDGADQAGLSVRLAPDYEDFGRDTVASHLVERSSAVRWLDD